MKILKMMFLMIVFCIFSEGALAYETFTHELISIRSSVKSLNYQKFKKDFGVDGIKKIREGSMKEDDFLTLRPVHHFYDPYNKMGLNSAGIQIGRASNKWGFNGGFRKYCP